MRLRCFLMAVLALLAAGCSVNPVTGERELTLISESDEIAMGEQHYRPTQQAMGGLYTADPELIAYVDEVGQRVAGESARPDLPYEFVIVNDRTPNAWALPGGKIGIHRGLLTAMESEAELAAVLGHEVVHSAARHGARRQERGLIMQAGLITLGVMTQDQDLQPLLVAGAGLGTALISQRHSRSAELEADYYGTRYMAKAGYDPQGAVDLQKKFVELAGAGQRSWLDGLFASHPPSEDRVEANRETRQALYDKYPDRDWTLGREPYRERVAVLRDNDGAYARLDDGRQALREGDAEQALTLADQAIDRYAEEPAFHGLRGQALARLGRDDEALEALDEAVDRGGDAFFAHRLERGRLHQRLGNSDAARRDLEASNQLLPTAPAHYGLGQLAEQSGERGRAVRHYRIAGESDSEVGKRARAALTALR